MARQGTKAGAGRAGAGTTCRDTGRLLDHSSYHPCRQLLPDGAPCRQPLPDAAALYSMQDLQRSRELFRTDRGRPCPREWEDPQAKRCGGMERSGSLCGRVAAPLERSICQIVSVHWIAAAQTDANLSAHLHRLPTPPPYLRPMSVISNFESPNFRKVNSPF